MIIAAAAVLTATVGFGLPATGAVSPVRAQDAAVTIKDYAYGPVEVTVTAGSVVTWTNAAGQAHTVTSNSGGTMDSGPIAPGEAFGNLFDVPGRYAYHCAIHPYRMKGTIVVTAAAATPGNAGTPEPTPPTGTLPPGFRSPSTEAATTIPGPTTSASPTASSTTGGADSPGPNIIILLVVAAAVVVVGVEIARRRGGPAR